MTTKCLDIQNLEIRAGAQQILEPITLQIRPGEILSVIGPAGSGKTTFLRALNRLLDFDKELTVSGTVSLAGQPIMGLDVDVPAVRRRVGIVFSTPTPLPMSIYENLTFGPRLSGISDTATLKALAEKCLRAADLWVEVKDRLEMAATNLSGGQQQRLCLARTLMMGPDVLLLDEPCSGLDPISTAKIEEALSELKKEMAIVLVTNNVKQAARVSDKTAFLYLGHLVEYGPTQQLFTNPKEKRTEEYITGRFG